MGVIEVDLFSEEVSGSQHPVAAGFRRLLESVADEYGCELCLFEVDQGTVTFSFDSEELTSEILRILQTRRDEL